MRALLDAADAACRAFAAATALESPHAQLSYGELSERAEAIAGGLRAAGAQADEPIVLALSNRAPDWAGFIGIWRAGGVAVPLHRTTPTLAAAALLERCGARFIVDCEPALGAFPGAGGAGPTPTLRVLDRPAPPARPLLAGAALVVFTSGSTGQPKGVVLSHAALAGKLAANDRILGFGRATRTLLVLQATFSFGFWVSFLTLTRGGTLRVNEKFDVATALAALAEHDITTVALVPTMLRALFAAAGHGDVVQAIAQINARRRLSQLLAGGEPLGALLAQRTRALFPCAALYDIFGLTETATSDFFLSPDEQPQADGSIGRPGPGVDFRIAGPDGAPVTAGIAGELQIRTPYAMNGYLDAPQLTADAFSDGYFRTGDSARLRPDGTVELVGRIKEMIVRGGNKVAPLEIEQAFAAHPAVAETLATGVPDALLGERIHLLVVARPGASPAEAELRAWARERLEKFKQPDAYHYAAALPLGRTGKADRSRLRELIVAGAPLAPG